MRVNNLVHVMTKWLVLGSLVSKDGRSDISRILMPSPYPTAGLCPKTFHLDLVIPPWGGFNPGPPSSQFLEAPMPPTELLGLGYFNQMSGSIVFLENIQQTKTLAEFRSGVVRNGTCFTSSECQDRGGSSSGNCASGWGEKEHRARLQKWTISLFLFLLCKSFGVCCIFIVTASQTVITQNCTYIQNENFPAAQPNTNAVQYTVQKCADGTCLLKKEISEAIWFVWSEYILC